MITQTIENKILSKLERIESLLFRMIPKDELNEDDVLEIVEYGKEAYKKGETIEFDELIKTQFPHLKR